jgi:hypothetical protein
MNIEQMLEQELHVVADGLDVPVAPMVDLVRDGERVRNRTRVYVVGLVAAAVALVVTGLALANGDPRAEGPGPSTTSPSPNPTRVVDENLGLPTGEAPSIPYIVDEKLFVGDERVPGLWEYLPDTQIGGNTVANWSPEKGWLLVENGQVQNLQVDRGAPKLSPDGRFLVHFVGADLVLRDLVADREVGRTRIEDQPDADQEYRIIPRGVDNAGRVFYGNTRVFMWDGSGQPVPVTLPSGRLPILGDIYDVMSSQIVMSASENGPLSLATVGDDGRITLEQSLPPRTGPNFVSPDGSWVAWQTTSDGKVTGNLEDPEEDAITVQRVASDERFTIPLNSGSFIRDVRWESDHTVLITMSERVVRCDLVERACEYAVAP